MVLVWSASFLLVIRYCSCILSKIAFFISKIFPTTHKTLRAYTYFVAPLRLLLTTYFMHWYIPVDIVLTDQICFNVTFFTFANSNIFVKVVATEKGLFSITFPWFLYCSFQLQIDFSWQYLFLFQRHNLTLNLIHVQLNLHYSCYKMWPPYALFIQ